MALWQDSLTRSLCLQSFNAVERDQKNYLKCGMQDILEV